MPLEPGSDNPMLQTRNMQVGSAGPLIALSSLLACLPRWTSMTAQSQNSGCYGVMLLVGSVPAARRVGTDGERIALISNGCGGSHCRW